MAFSLLTLCIFPLNPKPIVIFKPARENYSNTSNNSTSVATLSSPLIWHSTNLVTWHLEHWNTKDGALFELVGWSHSHAINSSHTQVWVLGMTSTRANYMTILHCIKLSSLNLFSLTSVIVLIILLDVNDKYMNIQPMLWTRVLKKSCQYMKMEQISHM